MAALPDCPPCRFAHDAARGLLTIQLPAAVAPGAQFALRTESETRPTAHVLEGLYYDSTPAGAPRTIITQCQQHGFQRIAPAMDVMNAKSYFTVRIVADRRYTNVLSNGDPALGTERRRLDVEEAFPPTARHAATGFVEPDASRSVTCYHNHAVNMATYLFFLGLGTYSTYRRVVEYPDGDSFLSELLVLPGRVAPQQAVEALAALHDSILWVNHSCGPEATDHEDERRRLCELLAERESIKAQLAPPVTLAAAEADQLASASRPHARRAISSKAIALDSPDAAGPGPLLEAALAAPENAALAARLARVREELRALIGAWRKTGYKYTARVYREISMENSDYGGMENVNNTTILASRIAPSEWTTDAAYQYMEAVKVHEFYHNINGSQVTGQSPFEIWLNEAVTVHVERQRTAALFGADAMRLKDVMYAFTPGSGPLAQDRSPISMAVEPDGFNRTQELISAMTYAKAPEFVRMVELVLGKRDFNRGLDLYYTRYSHGNATSEQWIEAMEEASGKSLKSMARGWLKRTGFPDVAAETSYDAAARRFTVRFRQTGFEQHPAGSNQPWEVPISWSLVRGGAVTHEGLFMLTAATGALVVEGVSEQPDFASLARSWSFFGTMRVDGATDEQLALQARSDPDMVNRYFAFRALADREKARLVESAAPDATASDAYVEVASSILFDARVPEFVRAVIVSEPDSITTRPDLAHKYWELHHARQAMRRAIMVKYGSRVLGLYSTVAAKCKGRTIKDDLHLRPLKHITLTLAAAAADTMAETLCMQMLDSKFASDRTVALARTLESDWSSRSELFETALTSWKRDPIGAESLIGIVAGMDAPDAPVFIRRIMADKSVFTVSNAGHTRLVARGWSANRKRSVLTDEGLALTEELFATIGLVNQMSAQPLLDAFADAPKFDAAQRARLLEALRRMRSRLDAARQTSLFNLTSTIIDKVSAVRSP